MCAEHILNVIGIRLKNLSTYYELYEDHLSEDSIANGECLHLIDFYGRKFIHFRRT